MPTLTGSFPPISIHYLLVGITLASVLLSACLGSSFRFPTYLRYLPDLLILLPLVIP